MTTDTYWISGAQYPYAQTSSDFKPVHNTLQGQIQAAGFPTQYNSFTSAGQFFDQMTVYDWITNYVPGGHGSQLGTLLNAAYNEEYGAETTGQSAVPAPGRSTAPRTSATTLPAATRICRSRSRTRSRPAAFTSALR
jgi:hypothetical protein